MEKVSFSLPHLAPPPPRRVNEIKQRKSSIVQQQNRQELMKLKFTENTKVIEIVEEHDDEVSGHREDYSLQDILSETYEDMLEDYSEFQGQHRKLLRDNGMNGSDRLLNSKRTRRQIISTPDKRSSRDLGSRNSLALKTIEEPPMMFCKFRG
jgi:hypothetical protein